MAWKWLLASPVAKGTNSTDIQVDIKYYDDADAANTPTPTKFLHAQSFFFEASVDNASMLTMVQSEGQRARTAFTRAAVIAQSFAPGTSGAVP